MTRVYVGMSGGVDSSVTAALLVEQGYDVTGVYMKNWTEDLPGMICPWANDLADAKRVAVQLGIPFKVYDFQKEYRQNVVDYMIDEYKQGRTPNPDIMCNQEVKFKLFLDAALADGADMIATGHYAQVVHASEASARLTASGPLGAKGRSVLSSSDGKSEPSSAKRADASLALLQRAVDHNKDQTYFLYRAGKAALAKTLFPLGGYEKAEVRAMAEKRGLVTAAKKDSQGICFVGQIGIRDFLGTYVTTEPGNVVEKDSGKILGQHDGAIYYTIGQRSGLGIGGGLPLYVVGKDMTKNEVYVTTHLNDEALWRQSLKISSLHWINQSPEIGRTYQVRLRHRGQLIDASLTPEGDTMNIELTAPERAITAGQSAVVYDGDTCLGGGIVV